MGLRTRKEISVLKKITPIGVLIIVCTFGLSACGEKTIPCPEAKPTTPETNAQKKTAASRELLPVECAQRVLSERDTALRDLAKTSGERDDAKKQYDAINAALTAANFSTETDPTSGAIKLHPNEVANADSAAPAPTIEAGKIDTAQPAAPASKAN